MMINILISYKNSLRNLQFAFVFLEWQVLIIIHIKHAYTHVKQQQKKN